MHGVGDVIGPVHYLGFDAFAIIAMALAQPLEQIRVLVIGAVFAVGAAIGIGFGPGVFAGTVEGGAGEVEAEAARHAAGIVHDDLGL